MPQHGFNLGQGAERQRGRACSQRRCNKDGSGRGSKRPGDEAVRWRRTESEYGHRPGIAMIGLVQQLAFCRSVTGKQRMDPALIRGAAAVVTLAVASRSHSHSRRGWLRMAVRHIGLCRDCIDRVNRTVHLAKRRAQHHGQGQQAHQPAHHPDFTQAGATASGCWTAVSA